MYQLESGRSILDRYRSRRNSDGPKEVVGFRVSPEVREYLETVAEQEGMETSTLLRCIAREFILTIELTDFGEGLKEAIAVESLKDIETWYSKEDAIAGPAAQIRSLIDTTTKD